MIDTNKYEGHTPKPWMCIDLHGDIENKDKVVCSVKQDDDHSLFQEGESLANTKLIEDAPLILNELRRYEQVFARAIECALNDNAEQAMQFLLNMDYCLDDEEKVTDKNRHKYTWVNGEWRNEK